ncbi:MAG: hypothetical protein GC134_04930 [Proteobacteria bacterium]|nr:hypothetical protein [Pseudomonadota bacterium]
MRYLLGAGAIGALIWFFAGSSLLAGLTATTLFVGFTWPFFALLALFFVVEFTCVENDSGVGATFTLLVFTALLYFLGGGLENPVIKFVIENWIAVVAAYFPIGALWMFAKWEGVLKRWDNDLSSTRKEFVAAKGITLKAGEAIPANLKDEWFRYAGRAAYKPNPNSYKSRFLLWIGYWPFSMAWSVTRQFFIRLFNLLDDLTKLVKRVSLFIYDRCSGALRYMVNRRAKKYDDDVK